MVYLYTFFVGGCICMLGQILIDKTKLTPARIVVTFVILGAILTAVGLYEPFIDVVGAGATVPITGFGYALINGVKEAVAKFGFVGAFVGGLTSTAGGISAAIFFGFVFSMFFDSKMK